MKRIYLDILAVVAVLTPVACDKENAEPDAGNVAPTFTAIIDGSNTRAYDTFWEEGDSIGISYGTSTPRNICYVTQKGDGKFTVKIPEEQIYYKSASRTTKVTFYAYYPWTDITGSTITGNTSNQANQKSFDYLIASAQGTKDDPEVVFQFVHKMSKVTLVFKDGQGFKVSNIKSYSFGKIYPTGTFSITSTTSASCSATLMNSIMLDVDLSEVEVKAKDGELTTQLILFPQTVPSRTTPAPDVRPVELDIFSYDNRKFTVDLTFPDNKLVSGSNYIFPITVNQAGPVVSDCTIENWTDHEWSEGGGTGTAGSTDDPEEE